MPRLTLRLLAILLFSILFISLAPNQVYACSFGPPPPLEPQLENAFAIVGEVVETDYLGQNMIVRVERYITGGAGPEYIVVMRNRPVVVDGVLDEQLGNGDCNFIEPAITVGEQGFMLLGRTYYGYYAFRNWSLINSRGGYAYVIPDEPTEELSYYGACDDCENGIELVDTTYDSFLGVLSDVTGDTPTDPIIDAFMPTTQQLLLTTSEGTDYILPIDGVPEPIEMTFDNFRNWFRSNFASVMRDYVDGFYDRFDLIAGETCTAFDCIALADDGSQFAFSTADGMLRLPYGYELSGDRAMFSPDGDVIAVWDDDLLTIYELNYRQFVQESYGYTENPPQNITLLEVTLNDATMGADVVWSVNGRSLAYSNAEGLWIFDTWFPDTEPRLLMPPNVDGEIPLAQQFSPINEFLTFSIGDISQTIDLRSGALMIGGLVSPSQTILLAPSVYPFGLIPLREAIAEADSSPIFDVTEYMWLDDERFVWFTSDYGQCLYRINDIDAMPQTLSEDALFFYCTAGLLSRDYWVVAFQQTVMINEQMIDLTGLLDGDIVGLRWLPSLMYGG